MVLEFSSLLTDAERDDVIELVRNVIDVINETSPVGEQSRIGLMLYSDVTYRIFTVRQSLSYADITDLVDQLSNLTRTAGTSGIGPALDELRDQLRWHVQRFNSVDQSIQQVVIVFQHNAISQATLTQSSNVLAWFMTRRVHVVQAGACSHVTFSRGS